MTNNKTMTVANIEVGYRRFNNNDFISLTDMAKYDDPQKTGYVITKWLSTRYTIEFMGVWETVNNSSFNVTEFGNIRNESGGQSYYLSQKQWIERTNAIGIISSTGRYGGTYAHKDIAFEFATWLSAEFKYWIIHEFQRLKETEQAQLQWTARRELTKLNYHIHTDAIKETIVPTLNEHQKTFVYADEADVLNVALFGYTALQWRSANPDKVRTGNVRDYANIHQLLVLANMESYNAAMIKDELPQVERIQKLNDMARHQLPILMQANASSLLSNGRK